MAGVQANNLLDDGSQVEAGPFVAHGGPLTERFIEDTLLQHLKKFERRTVWANVVKRKTDASSSAEEAYENFVRMPWPIQPRIIPVEWCYLVDVIEEGVVHIAKVGDSRVRTPTKFSRRDQLAERRQDVAHKTRSTRLNRKTEKRDTRMTRKTEKR